MARSYSISIPGRERVFTITLSTGQRTFTVDAQGVARSFQVETGIGPPGPGGEVDLAPYQLKPSEGAFVNGDKTKLDGIDAALDLKADKSNVIERDNTGAFTPTLDYHPATKKYVDDNAGGGGDLSAYQLKPSEGAFVNGDKTKLDGIEPGADVTDAANVTAAGALMDSEVANLAAVKAFDPADYAPALGADDNYVTDAEKTVIGNTSGTNTGDQDLSAYQLKPSEGAFVNGDKTKLDGIEPGADVTDAANVTAAGALMDSEVTNLAAVKAFDPADYAPALGADDNYVTDAEKTVIGNTSGTNTGDQDLSAYQLKPSEGAFVNGDKTKLDGIDAGLDLKADKSNVIERDNTGAFTPTLDYHPATKKYVDDNAGGGGDLSAYQLKPSEGAFVNGDKTKLDGIEAGADVTDTANVTAAGALMDSEVANLAAVKAFDPADYAPALGGDDNYVTDAEKTKLGHISVTQPVDLDSMESGIGKRVLELKPSMNWDSEVSSNMDLVMRTDYTTVNAAWTQVRITNLSADSVALASVSGVIDIPPFTTTTVDVTNEGGSYAIEDVGPSFRALAHTSVLAATTASFTTADETKLDGIEPGADVTDTANVTAAGALMDSEVTNLAAVKAFNPADYATTRTGVYRQLWIGAAAMIPRTTNGAAAATVELSTNDVMLDALDFDTATEEGAGFWANFGDQWDGGTVKVKVYWTAASGSGTVKWDFAAQSFADSDVIDQALGTEQGVTDTLITANDVHISSATASLTIADATAGEPVYFQIARDVANDTLGVDARLIGVMIQYLESATEHAAW